MKSLYLRIYLTMVAALLLFALVAGWLAQNHLDQERERVHVAVSERMVAWGELIANSLPPADAPLAQQRDAVQDWSQRLRMALALDDARGQRIAVSDAFERMQSTASAGQRLVQVPLRDGRSLWVARMAPRPLVAAEGPRQRGAGAGTAVAVHLGGRPLFVGGIGLAAALVVLFVAVAVGAFPVVRRLTRRLENLQRGVETFGRGALDHRVEVEGRDEVAAVAHSFNRTAERVEQLVRSHQSLLANASHELRSPLARMKMAVALFEHAQPPQKDRLRQEIDTNIAELDALVEEVLLASRLDALQQLDRREPVDLVALVAEEAARCHAGVQAPVQLPQVVGDERLLRRAVRNLLENARRYGGGEVDVQLSAVQAAAVATGNASRATVELRVCDRGPGVPAAMRERIFEPFFRLPGHAEQAGGIGLGLSLVKQIAERHGGRVRCEAREGGGSCFVMSLNETDARSGPSSL